MSKRKMMITVSGKEGKTILQHQLAVFLKQRGHDVKLMDDFHIPSVICEVEGKHDPFEIYIYSAKFAPENGLDGLPAEIDSGATASDGIDSIESSPS